MRIFHILNDGPTKLSDEVIKVQSRDNEVRIIDLAKGNISYENVVDDILSFDRVVSW